MKTILDLERLDFEGDVKKLKKCYGLFCYMKSRVGQGMVEFIHNNIQDFFMAEKIYREMDGLW